MAKVPKPIEKRISELLPPNRANLGEPIDSADILRKSIPQALLNSISQYSSQIATEATKYVESRLPFFAELPAIKRADIQYIIQTSVSRFVQWVNNPPVPDKLISGIDDLAIRLSHQLSLHQSVEITRQVLEFFEHGVPLLAQTNFEKEALRELVLRYGWEIGFTSAAAFADVAETRGSLDARIEASIIDAIIRGEESTSILSQAAVLNITHTDQDLITVLACEISCGSKDYGSTPPGFNHEPRTLAQKIPEKKLGAAYYYKGDTGNYIAHLHAVARYHNRQLLAGMHGQRLVIVNFGKLQQTVFFKELQQSLPDTTTIIGPTVQGLGNAHRSAREALSAITALPAWTDAPKVVYSSELLAERAISGDTWARTSLIDTVVKPISNLDPSYRETLDKYISTGTVELTAAELFVHPNTVRYRLKKIADLTGFDLFNNRDAFAVKLAFIYFRLSE